jgi:5'-nucleotidase
MSESQRPLILVTNDDSYRAKGIKCLIEAVAEFGDLLIVSPEDPQSGMGHAITLNAPLRLKETQDFAPHKAYTCGGTPVDCVKLAIYGILKKKPDLIVSGINHGANFSINVLYSGTMSAAVEGALEGVPSIGFSLLDYDAAADFEGAMNSVKTVVSEALKQGIPAGTCLNVNIPKGRPESLAGIKICRQGKGHWEDEFVKRDDPMGKPYYWLSGAFENLDKGEDTDTWALNNNYVSVVPVHFDMTAHKEIATLNNWDL